MTKKDPSIHTSIHKRLLKPRVKTKEAVVISNDPVPRITNETIETHREEVLGGARKFIYPLQHSKHKIVIVTLTIVFAVAIGFMSYMILSLYRWQSTSNFVYQVTKVLPLPVARIGGTLVSYENYLFELRHYIHYFENQQEVDFNSEQGSAQLSAQREKSLQRVVDYAYIKKIARDKNMTITSKEVDDQITLLKRQNKLGSDNKIFENILKDYWGWTIADFRRSIEQELLTNKVIQVLDIKTKTKAENVLKEIKVGQDFGTLARKYSDDTATKDKGGELGFLVSKSDRNIPPQTLDALFKLKAGEVSGIVDLGYGLEIIKHLGEQDGKIKAARIFFTYQDINYYLNDYKEKQKAQVFIKT